MPIADVNNSDSVSEDLPVTYRVGCLSFANSAGADEITAADIGNVAFVIDDQMVARTNDTNTRSPAGVIEAPKLAFADHIAYSRNERVRTPKTSMVFSVLEGVLPKK